MRAIIKSAEKIDELMYTLENISSDDKKKIEDYIDAEIVHEAKYVLEQFTSSQMGHINYEAMTGEEGQEQQTWARSEVRKLKALIKKYS